MAAAAQGAAAAPQASVRGQNVVNPAAQLTVRVPKRASYVGSERFELYGNADCELHVFVDADSHKRIRRYYWVQFEQYLPTKPDSRYNYSNNRRATLWGAPAWIAAGFGRSDQPSRAGSDREHLNALLAAHGYSMPAKVMQVRIVRLPDDPAGTGRGRRELMLIYGEDLALTGESYEALGGDGDGTARWREIEPALVARAEAAFKVSGR